MKIQSGDAEISYQITGKGPDLVLLHPFPVNHEFWAPVVEALDSKYRVTIPDLRGHGDSAVGVGPATMEKHAEDLKRICDEVGIGRAVFGGVSIGGYVLFEFWRRHPERFSGLLLSDTKAAGDTDEVRSKRLAAADDVEKYGPERYIEEQIPKLMSETTRQMRPDLVRRAREMMGKMTVAGIAGAQRGMAMRQDSTPILGSISVPTLLLFGEDDQATTTAEARAMSQRLPSSVLQVIPQAGHYAIFEQQEEAARILRSWLDQLPRW